MAGPAAGRAGAPRTDPDTASAVPGADPDGRPQHASGPLPHRLDEPVQIIGAGLAGLAAAVHLHRAGLPVAVTEAGDRVGGRVRTEAVDGFLLDAGFQVHNTAYPEVARLVAPASLDLGLFTRGALLATDTGLHRVADPRHDLRALPALLRAPLGGPGRAAAMAVLGAGVLAAPPRWLTRLPDVSTAAALRRAGVGAAAVETLWRPFLSGVLLDDALDTAARFTAVVLRCFITGRQGLPAQGMAALPGALAGLLPPGTVALQRPATALPAGPVIVATDAATAHRLLPELGPAPPLTAVTTVYHASTAAPRPGGEPILAVDGSGRRRFTNTAVLSDAQPRYAPAGSHLVSTSVLGDSVDEPALRAALRDVYGAGVADWTHLDTVVVRGATPLLPAPGGTLRRPVRVRPGVYVAGDHRDTPSTQGAMVSGRRAAAALLADLGRR